jgi:hypothetical protein
MGPIRWPETSVNNYHTTPCNNPEDHRFHQHRGVSLKSRVSEKFNEPTREGTGLQNLWPKVTPYHILCLSLISYQYVTFRTGTSEFGTGKFSLVLSEIYIFTLLTRKQIYLLSGTLRLEFISGKNFLTLWCKIRLLYQVIASVWHTICVNISSSLLITVISNVFSYGVSFNRTQSRVVTGLFTGHNTLRRHLHIMGLSDSVLCRKCGAEEETSADVLCECEVLATHRHTYLGSFCLDPEDIRELSLGAIWTFITRTGLLWLRIKLRGTKGLSKTYVHRDRKGLTHTHG